MANLTADFMFNRDLKDAFLHIIKSFVSANVQEAKVQNVVKFFICPPEKLEEKIGKYGCWCDVARISPHHYEYCDNIKGIPYPSVIGKDLNDRGKRKVSHLPLCPDLDINVPDHRKDHNHRLGCFKPLESAEKFMDWFIEQGVRNYSALWSERMAVRNFVDDYMGRVSIFETGEFNKNDKEDMVLSLLLGFQGRDIEDGARKSHVAWEAERLLKFLGWNRYEFETGLKELRSAMEEVIKMRLPTNSFRGGRSRREWETPRRSPPREQYQREESPRRRYRREYSPWRGISPEELYKGEGSTWRGNPPDEQYNKGKSTQRRNPPEEPYRGKESTRRRNPLDERYYGGDERQWQGSSREIPKHNPPKEQPRRGRDKSSRPKEQSRGGYKSRQPSPSEGRFTERVADFMTEECGRQLAKPSRGKFTERAAVFLTKECGRRVTDLTEECEKRLADPSRGYEGWGSSSSRKRYGRR